MRSFSKATIASIAALTLLLTGCSKAEVKSGIGSADKKATVTDMKSSDYLEASYDELKEGGELHLSIGGAINPQLNVGHADMDTGTSDLWPWTNPQIALFDKDSNWYANPNFISSVKSEVVDGKTVVTWDINPKATFNDGTPVDYRAFQGMFKAFNETNDEYAVADTDGYKDMESVERGKNDKQVIVTYKFQYPWWKKNFEFLIHPAATKDPKTFNEAYLENARPEWGAGPYKVESIDFKAGTLVLVKNEKWWGKPAKLDKVTFRALEPEAEVNAFLNNQLDAIGVGTQERLAKIKDMDNISQYTGVRIYQGMLELNGKSDVFTDKRVREAFFHSINRPKIVEIAFKGLNYTEPPLGSMLLFPFVKGYEDNVGKVGDYDPKKSEKLLKEAGWTKKDNYFQKDGKDLEVHIPQFPSSQNRKAQFGAIQAMAKEVGIKVVFDEHKPSEYPQILKNRNFDALITGFGSSNPFGIADTCQVYGSKSVLNKTGLFSQEIDDLCQKSIRSDDEATSIKFGNQAEKKALELAGILPLFSGPSVVATRKGLANMGAMGFVQVPKELIGWKK
ncbi:hypothetical protein BSR29_06770 [Boudabousia liubingyangii]|uniref:Solute-binding protein family 5 domain-containing protein n=1 Tax=Boudabousia liubingyangii TaxID=1921764 RepID=A0A1Q5PKZ1_9ACTO|nr:ABC transporter family substrate-binding protein [Boudabousia liubingyangii]OKL46368.1 hypothetical protein BSR28_07510 [Boudabousia liubingyangii]OKL47309.1 hypothetical protein BSR29_06770 [Boudabousia liubingyangii]